MDARLLKEMSDGIYKAMLAKSNMEPGRSEFHAKPGYEKAVSSLYEDYCDVGKEASRRGGWHNLSNYDLKHAKKRGTAKPVLPIKTRSERNRLNWLGTAREFGDWIIEAFDAGKLKANSQTDALIQAAEHFVGQDGKRLKPHSIWQNRRNRDNYKDAKKPAPQ